MIRNCSWLGLWLIVAGVAPADETKVVTLKDYATRIQGRHAFGVYVKNQKIGWSILDGKLTKHDGKDAFSVVEETYFEIKRGEGALKMHITSKNLFSLEDDGELLRIEEINKEGDRTVTRKGERQGDIFIITSSSDPKRERKVKPPRRNFAMNRKLDDWLRSEPKKGAVFESFGVSLEDADHNTPESWTFQGKKTLLLSGVKTDLYHVLVKSKGAVSDMDVLADGTPVRATVGGFLELRSEPEAQAKKVTPGEIDLLSLASIKVDKELGDPHEIIGLTLEVHGLGDYELPVCHRQQVKPGKEKGVLVLNLRRDFKPEKAELLKDSERKKMMEATPTVQSDAKEVKDLAEKIVGKETDIHKKASLIRRWVYRKLKKTYDANASTTLEVLKNMAGDCTEHALFFVSLARAVGIPAREVGGVGYYSNGEPMFGWHAWGEYHDGHQWVAVDPTWNQERVDATHVKFSDSAEDMAWVNVLGKVKFKALNVEKK